MTTYNRSDLTDIIQLDIRLVMSAVDATDSEEAQTQRASIEQRLPYLRTATLGELMQLVEDGAKLARELFSDVDEDPDLVDLLKCAGEIATARRQLVALKAEGLKQGRLL